MSNLFCFFISLLALATSAAAQTPVMTIKRTPSFGLPIDCAPSEDCWAMNYVDYGVNDQKKTDLSCLERTYDGHKGTDFALLDGVAMQKGVDVLASADGTVTRLRDSEKDGWHTDEELAEIKKSRKECGNGIFIDHGNGVETVYCHLKLGSITVKKDQAVQKGDKIAQVGQSGLTEFPHLHFGIIKDGKILDPFTGKSNQEECGQTEKTLWDKNVDLQYRQLTIQSAEFLDQVPDFKEIEKQAPTLSEIKTDAEALTFLVTILGVREGDEVSMKILDPNGKEFAKRKITQEKTRARQYYFVGKRINPDKVKEGAYTGVVDITRDDQKWSKNSAILVTE